MSWTIDDFPFAGGGGAIVYIGYQSGNVLNVPADDSAAVFVPFSPAYSLFVKSINCTASGGAAESPSPLTAEPYGPTLNGFFVKIKGGAPNTTATLYWEANGI
jgi:hypothetical protein